MKTFNTFYDITTIFKLKNGILFGIISEGLKHVDIRKIINLTHCGHMTKD